MPERVNTHRYDTADVQGEGSYIILRAMTLGEIITQQRDAEERRGAGYKIGALLGRIFRKRPSPTQQARINMLQTIQYVRGWNWVDDNGDPFPLPSEDPRVLDRLVLAEMQCITDCVNGVRQSEEQKN